MTEKNYNPEQRNSKAMKNQAKASKKISKEIIKDIEKSGVPKEVAEKEEKLDEKAQKAEQKTEEKTEAEKPKEEKKPEIKRPKKSEAVVNALSLPISTKTAMAICRFIRGKRINFAIEKLEQVVEMKIAIPMKGEIPHRHGKGMMSGRYPKKASEIFIKLLKSLSANANFNGIENPAIAEAIANIASRPHGKFGAVRKKRTHVKLIARQKAESLAASPKRSQNRELKTKEKK
ncbi:MAG TPA: uL22 family ribosomal protein [Candidatus Nanoarchaeia archaeon]|nr:uL22 family ribosomal protein [Candidatus Nanoarchaeia archaeon]